METALITGASSGIGKEFAYIFAKNGIKTILAARSIDKLTEIAADIQKKFNIEAIPLQYDLSIAGNDKKLYDEIKLRNIQIDFLINNAGFGDVGELSTEKLDKYTEMLNLNINALTRLSVLFFEDMKKQKSGKILNVASTAAFQPIPLFSIYAATKAYVLSFSEALHFEAKPYGIGVTALCPGPTETNFGNVAGFKFDRKEQKSEKNTMTARKVAEIAYAAMMKNKMTIIPGSSNKIGAFMAKIIPSRKLIPATIYNRFKKMLEKKQQ